MAKHKSIWSLLQDEEYNNFFHPNICHICKNSNNPKECSCGMISYCGKEHMMLHKDEHKEICDAMIQLSKDRDIWNNRDITQKEWIKFKKENIRSVEKILHRDLKPYERRMFLFAKSCFVCHKQKNLTSCKHCSSVYSCPNHQLIDILHSCESLQMSLTLDWNYIYCTEKNRRISTLYMYLNKKGLRDMETFVRLSRLHFGPKNTWGPRNYLYTDDFTGPLTLIYGMQDTPLFYHLQKRSNLNIVIHLLTEQHTAPHSFTTWEIVLHELDSGAQLTIVSIGLESWNNFTFEYELCRTCRSKSNRFISDNCQMLYDDYVNSIYYSRPDMIVAFDIDFQDQKAPTKIIKAVQSQNCPLFLTAKSEIKANDNINLIHEVLGSHINPIVSEENRFASLRPHQDYENKSVFYRNQYLVIYHHLRG